MKIVICLGFIETLEKNPDQRKKNKNKAFVLHQYDYRKVATTLPKQGNSNNIQK